jgi:hypothetical protein
MRAGKGEQGEQGGEEESPREELNGVSAITYHKCFVSAMQCYSFVPYVNISFAQSPEH